MAVVRSLKRTLSILAEQPVLFVPLLLLGALQAPSYLANTLDPIVSAAVSLGMTVVYLFVTPFFHGGLIGMANDAAAGDRTSLDRFLTVGRERYLSLLGAYALVYAVATALGVAITIAVFLAFLAYSAAGGGIAVAVGAAIVPLLLIAVYLAVMAAVSFYGHAIVIEDHGAIDGIKRSVAVVRANLAAVVGYLLVALVGGGLVGAAAAAVSLLAFPTATAPDAAPGAVDPTLAAVGVVGIVAATALLGGFLLVFSVVFYRDLVGAGSTEDREGADGRPASGTAWGDDAGTGGAEGDGAAGRSAD